MRESEKIKKDKILNKAIAVFAEKGFRKTTMSELAKSAGISEATLYKHYNNKEKILFYGRSTYESNKEAVVLED